jgi:hypothetical protein
LFVTTLRLNITSHLMPRSPNACAVIHPVSTLNHGLSKSVPHLLFYIGSQAIEFVDKWPHLGHIISNDCNDADDILTKKMNFIGQPNKVLHNFRNVDCVTKTKLVNAIALVFTAKRFGTCLIAILN